MISYLAELTEKKTQGSTKIKRCGCLVGCDCTCLVVFIDEPGAFVSSAEVIEREREKEEREWWYREESRRYWEKLWRFRKRREAWRREWTAKTKRDRRRLINLKRVKPNRKRRRHQCRREKRD